jgi:putative transposase
MLKAYKYRLYPTINQQEYLNQVFGDVRFVWNKLVENFNSYSSMGPNRPMNEKILKDDPQYPWLKDSISYALQQKTMDFEETKKQFFNKKRKIQLGRMNFKKKDVSKDSFRIPGQALGFNKCIDFNSGKLKISKMTPIKLVVDREFTGQLRSVTVSKNKCNQYFVSILVEENIELKQNTGRSIGIDLGLNSLLSLNNGIKVSNPRWFRESQAKLVKSQRHLSRKSKGSNRYNKQKLKVARIHLKISNQRQFVLHNLTTWLVDNYDNIFVENLNVEGMKRSNLGKSVSDASFSTFLSMLEYKCDWYGKLFNKVDKWFPSSKQCSNCGYKNVDLQRSDSNWICSDCGTEHDRDINAAINIHNQGLLDVYNLKSEELPDYRRGEELRPFKCSHLKGIFVEPFSNFYSFYRNA